MSLYCHEDLRRDAVRHKKNWNGLDYVEVSDDQRTLTVYFLGKLPPELSENKPGIEHFLAIEGGQRVRDIAITDIDPVVDSDPEKDDYLVVRLDKYGDFSTYVLRLVGVEHIDPRYDSVEFSFKVGCPSDMDCATPSLCEPDILIEPEINYLAKDYASFRQLILDRFALLMPDWKERHVPDLGVALVELLAYTGDNLSYYQDAVATEAYLDTARQRISVRRHARLVDYTLHEGCNARAWVSLETDTDYALPLADVSFITGLNDALNKPASVLTWDDLDNVPASAYEVFEPLPLIDAGASLQLYAAHNRISLYGWGQNACCIDAGSTCATLLDAWILPTEEEKAKHQHPRRALHLKAGDVLVFEEVLGPVTGLPADADPAHRHAVRLTKVTPGADVLYRTADGLAVPYLNIEWSAEDALPFALCVSALGGAPECAYFNDVSVARGNVILVDHGRTQGQDLGQVPVEHGDAHCECVGHPGDAQVLAGRFRPSLEKAPLTYREPLPQDDPAHEQWASAADLAARDACLALPQVKLTSDPPQPWEARYDLLGSHADDRHFVVEIDNGGIAHLRFGDGELGYQPQGGSSISASYRVGNGTRGNVGAESISRLIVKSPLSGITITVRNPLPAFGGKEPEPIAEAKLFAPHLFRKRLERAIIADDYQQITERNRKVQRASAALVWTGSWYEADVAIDPFGGESTDDALLADITRDLGCYRRMGHDLHVTPARYVPLHLKLEVCALPYYQRAHVKAALLAVFSNRRLPGGKLGFFHPDNLTFGEGIYLSRIIAAAQAVTGVECVKVTVFHRLFESPNHEIDNGVLPLLNAEIAQLDNDPNYPERGKLEIQVEGGR